jgi:hypothetical protein
MSTKADEWIGVAEVAAELKLSERAAWELVRRLAVPMLEVGRAVLSTARFRRSDWEAARDRALQPPAPRSKSAAGAAAGEASGAAVASAAPRPARVKRSGPDVAKKLARLRGAGA